MKPLRTILILIPLLVPLPVVAQSSDVAQIKIVSSWAGLGDGKHSELVIQRKSGGYFQNGKRVKDDLIYEFMAALNEPVITGPELANLGISQSWLDANAEKGVKEYADFYFSTAASNQQALYISSFRNREFIGKVIQSLFSGMHTDDYPHFEFTMTDAVGKVITVTSDSQFQFMLPWKVTRDGRATETYNAHISQAVASLLPEKFANRWRIAGEGLRRDVAEVVMRWIRDDWKSLDAENKAGKYLEPLRNRFTVKTAEINSNHNVEYGKEPVNGNSTETNLHVTLRARDFPKSFFIGAVLPYNNDRVGNVDVFLNSIDRYQNLTLSVQWLSEYIASHPKTNIELRFIADRSFGDKGMQSFAADMKSIGKDALINEVAAVQKDVSLLRVGREYYQAHWLVLPDGRMILWRFRGYDALLKWVANDFTHTPCNEYQGECVGAVISRDGTIASK